MDDVSAACRKLGINLTPDQGAALADVLDAVAARRPHLVTGYAGSGKTTLMQVLSVVLMSRRIKTALTAPTHKAVSVLARKLTAAHIEDVPTATIHRLLSLSPKARGDRQVFERRKDAPAVDADVVVVDECFVGSTMVDTPAGPVRIDRLRVGDAITNAAGVDLVIATKKKKATHVSIIKFGDQIVASSPCHRFFTGRGIVRASDLRPGDQLVQIPTAMRLLLDDLFASSLDCPLLLASVRDAVVVAAPGISGEDLYAGARAEVRGGKIALAEIGRPSGEGRVGKAAPTGSLHRSDHTTEDQHETAEYGAPSRCPGREWQGDTAPSSGDVCGPGAGLGVGVCGLGGQGARQRLADSLQDRYCGADTDDCHRDRRTLARGPCATTTRRAQGFVPGFFRVDSVAIHQCRSHELDQYRDAAGDIYLYDIQAERHSSFGVGGVLAHNCSMNGEDTMGHIERHLTERAVIYVGDPAQLPPVNEEESRSFATPRRSHLGTIVRQAADNPLLDAALAIRNSQRGPMDWTWCREARAGNLGVFLPRDRTDHWMRRAFTSQAFQDDPDTHRYLCWTNDRVAETNNRIRRWLYGDKIPTPFMPGERALFRGPLLNGTDIIANTNEETTVLAIEAAERHCEFEGRRGEEAWSATIPTWCIQMRNQEGLEFEAHMPRERRAYDAALARLVEVSRANPRRWQDYHAFVGRFARLQSIYAMTIHTSQGSTFRNVFLDVGDVRRRVPSNTLEAQQLLYVGATRPSHTLTLVGA